MSPSCCIPLLALAAIACSGARYGANDGQAPGVTLPARFAEGEREPDAPATRRVDAGPDGAAAAEAGAPPTGSLPDPEPLRSERQWEYSVVYEGGRVTVASVRPLVFRQPIVTARQMGRFAIELWIGHELVERVRFDFPLLAAEPPPPGVAASRSRPLHEPPRVAADARLERTVLVPASSRATRALLVDRATGSGQPLRWPPAPF